MKKQIGIVSVDSGQLLLCDPCYISDGFSEGEDWQIEYYEDSSGNRWGYLEYIKGHPLLSEENIQPFDGNFGTKQPNGKTPNEMIASGEWVVKKSTPVHELTYQGCCSQTLSEDRGGQLNHALGHPGAGVAVSTGYGDGEYPVFVLYGRDGRIKKVWVDFS